MKNLLHKLILTVFLLVSTKAFCQVPKLNSYTPSDSVPTIFLDFDGQTVQNGAWQSGNAFICAPSTLNSSQITNVFNRVIEDFRPFAINITTDSIKFFLAPPAKRVRIIVTPTSAWFPNVGGIAYTNTFTSGDDTPGFVFEDKLNYNPKYVGECCTHESGHTLGLAHQSRYDSTCAILETYNTGSGSGQISWAPVMGNSYYKNMTGWNQGPTPYACSNVQDNLTIITTTNGFTYRPDDYNQVMADNTTAVNPLNFAKQGIISTPTDKDVFKIIIPDAAIQHFEVNPYSVGPNNEGADLDVLVRLFNGSGTLIRTYNSVDAMNVSVDTSLTPGVYYIEISGAGNINTTNYGSLGSYTFSGFRGALPIHNVTLYGKSVKYMHELTWTIIADEPVAQQELESSSNGFNFQQVMTGNGTLHSYTVTPAGGTTYYRLRATSITGHSMLSNIVALKSGEERAFIVSTLVQQNISVTASENYSYALYDIKGTAITSGKQNKGTGSISMQNLPKGMYVLQMLSNDYKQTERIIRQ